MFALVGRSHIAPTSSSCWCAGAKTSWLDKPPHRVKVDFIEGECLRARARVCVFVCVCMCVCSGEDPEILKRWVLYVGHYAWSTKKILGFRWSKKAKITLETISFWWNTSIGIFKFSPFLYTMEACQWNLINFWKFTNSLIRKKKKRLCSSQWEKKNREKLDFV